MAHPNAHSSWSSLAVGLNGNSIVGAVSNNCGNIYVSADSGSTFIETAAPLAGPRTFTDTAISGNGSIQISLVGSVYPFVSIDYGSTWVERRAAGCRAWTGAASNSDGSMLVIASNILQLSRDQGLTWSTLTVGAGFQAFTGVTMDYSGQYIYACVNGGGIWRSTNGVNFTLAANTSSFPWTDVASSSNGSVSEQVGMGADGGSTQRTWLIRSTHPCFPPAHKGCCSQRHHGQHGLHVARLRAHIFGEPKRRPQGLGRRHDVWRWSKDCGDCQERCVPRCCM